MRFFAGLFLLFLLLVPVYALIHQWIEVPYFLIVNLEWIPYAIFVIGLILCVVFYNSREFCLLLLTSVIFWFLQQYVWSKGLAGPRMEQLFDLLAFLLPANILVLFYLGERGLLNQHGVKRLFLIISELAILAGLIQLNLLEITNYLVLDIFNTRISGFTVLKQSALIIWMITILAMLITWIIYSGFMNLIWIFVSLALLTAMHFVQVELISVIYFAIAGLILLCGIVINAYHLAYKDELTRLPSRRALKQQLLALGNEYAIAMVDVDHFKKLNDTYGHDAGDDVLKMLASHLSNIEGGGKAFRYGGEEFTLVFSGKDARYAESALDNLRKKIAATPFVIRKKRRVRNKTVRKKTSTDKKQIKVTVSIGVAERQDNHANPQDVIKSADKALYKAKESGRNQVTVS